MTNFWQDNVLADEFNAPEAPAPVLNLQEFAGSAAYPEDMATFVQSGLNVLLDAGSPSYSVTVPVINVARSGGGTSSMSIYAAMAPNAVSRNAYFDIEIQIKNASGAVVSTITQPASYWSYAGTTTTNSNSLMYMYEANAESTWPTASVLPGGEQGTLTLTITLNTTYGGSGSLQSGTLIGLILL